MALKARLATGWRSRVLGLCLLPCVPFQAAAAEPATWVITFAGINWLMSPDHMVRVLEGDAYHCRNRLDELVGPLTICADGLATVEVLPRFGVIEFNCHVHDACDLSQDEVVDGLVSSGLMAAAEPAGSDYYGEMIYCWDGPLGDALCVDSVSSLLLYRARLKPDR